MSDSETMRDTAGGMEVSGDILTRGLQITQHRQIPCYRRTFLRRNAWYGRGAPAPEAAVGGAIALVEEGDQITIDAEEKLLHLHLTDQELQQRKAVWKPRQSVFEHSVLAKYAKLVSSSSRGAVTGEIG